MGSCSFELPYAFYELVAVEVNAFSLPYRAALKALIRSAIACIDTSNPVTLTILPHRRRSASNVLANSLQVGFSGNC